MAFTYSPSLGLFNIASGTEAGNWGTLTNTNICVLLEQAIAGQQTIALPNNATPLPLTSDPGEVNQARAMGLVFTGVLTVNKPIIIPPVPKLYVVFNRTTGGAATNLAVYPAGAGLQAQVLQGQADIIWCDGANSYSLVRGNLNAYLPLRGGTLQAPDGSLNRTLTIQGALGQTGHLTQWNNSGGTLLAYIAQSGEFHSTEEMFATAFHASGPVTATGTISGASLASNGALTVANDSRVVGSSYFGNGTFRAYSNPSTVVGEAFDYLLYAPNHYWSYHRPSGGLSWTINGPDISFDFLADGRFVTDGTIIADDATFGGADVLVGAERIINISTALPGGYQITQYVYHEPGVKGGVGWSLGNPVTRTFRLQSDGIGYAPVSWLGLSDRRLKSDVEQIRDALYKVSTLMGCTFARNDLTDLDGKRRYAGVLAQDVRSVLPEAVSEAEGPPASDPGGGPTLAVDSAGVLALLVEAIKEIDTRLVAIESAMN